MQGQAYILYISTPSIASSIHHGGLYAIPYAIKAKGVGVLRV